LYKIIKNGDSPIVKVRYDNMGKALKILRRRVENYKTFKILKIRRLNPSPAARKKYKKFVASRRRKRK